VDGGLAARVLQAAGRAGRLRVYVCHKSWGHTATIQSKYSNAYTRAILFLRLEIETRLTVFDSCVPLCMIAGEG
jgi:hypothetical protein